MAFVLLTFTLAFVLAALAIAKFRVVLHASAAESVHDGAGHALEAVAASALRAEGISSSVGTGAFNCFYASIVL